MTPVVVTSRLVQYLCNPNTGACRRNKMTALSHIRVVEIANERIAWAGKLLGDMGADVILVEPTGGEPSRGYPPFADGTGAENQSLYFWHYNTSKRSVVIDLVFL